MLIAGGRAQRSLDYMQHKILCLSCVYVGRLYGFYLQPLPPKVYKTTHFSEVRAPYQNSVNSFFVMLGQGPFSNVIFTIIYILLIPLAGRPLACAQEIDSPTEVSTNANELTDARVSRSTIALYFPPSATEPPSLVGPVNLNSDDAIETGNPHAGLSDVEPGHSRVATDLSNILNPLRDQQWVAENPQADISGSEPARIDEDEAPINDPTKEHPELRGAENHQGNMPEVEGPFNPVSVSNLFAENIPNLEHYRALIAGLLQELVPTVLNHQFGTGPLSPKLLQDIRELLISMLSLLNRRLRMRCFVTNKPGSQCDRSICSSAYCLTNLVSGKCVPAGDWEPKACKGCMCMKSVRDIIS